MAEIVDPSISVWAAADVESSGRQSHQGHVEFDTIDLATPRSSSEPLIAPTSPCNTAAAIDISKTAIEVGASHNSSVAVQKFPYKLQDNNSENISPDFKAPTPQNERRFYSPKAVFDTAGERASLLPRSQIHTATSRCAQFGHLRSLFYNLFVLLWIVFVYVIPGTTFLILVMVLGAVPNLAIMASDGAVALLIGNFVLRAANLAHYAEPGSAAAIGATGTIFATICINTVLNWVPTDLRNGVPRFISFPLVVLLMTLSGVIGTSVLQSQDVNLGDTDVLHGARAGALGGAIIAPFRIIVGPMVVIPLGVLLTPLLIAMAAGFKWVWGRSNATWYGRWGSSSYCYTYGRCGADPEIDAEVLQFEAFAAMDDATTRQPAWYTMNLDASGSNVV